MHLLIASPGQLLNSVLALMISFAFATTLHAQSSDDFGLAAAALKEIERSVHTLEERGFVPEAEMLRARVLRVRSQLRKMRRESEEKGGFKFEEVLLGIQEAASREGALKRSAAKRGAEPSAKKLGRLRGLRRKLEKHRIDVQGRLSHLQGLMMSTRERRNEAALRLKQVRSGGDLKRVAELERKVRAFDAYLRRLKGDAERAKRIEVSEEVSNFLRGLRKRRKGGAEEGASR